MPKQAKELKEFSYPELVILLSKISRRLDRLDKLEKRMLELEKTFEESLYWTDRLKAKMRD